MKTSTSLQQLAEKIVKEHGQVVGSLRRSLDHAKTAGVHLQTARRLVKAQKLKWEEWVDGQCKLTPRTASRYMRLAKNWAEIEGKLPQDADPSQLTLNAALALIRTGTRKPNRRARQPLTLSQIGKLMRKYHLQADPYVLAQLLQDCGVKVKGAERSRDANVA